MELLVPTAIAAGTAGLLKLAEQYGPAKFTSGSLAGELFRQDSRTASPRSENARNVGCVLAA